SLSSRLICLFQHNINTLGQGHAECRTGSLDFFNVFFLRLQRQMRREPNEPEKKAINRIIKHLNF
ncbi:MAG: hypothetical protein ACXVJN_11115, partial [Mucilaginibacter sp.]